VTDTSLLGGFIADPQPPLANPLLQTIAGMQNAPRLPSAASQWAALPGGLLSGFTDVAGSTYRELTDPRNWAQAALDLEYQQRAAMTPGTDMSNTER
jgi:hypothetical protein